MRVRVREYAICDESMVHMTGGKRRERKTGW